MIAGMVLSNLLYLVGAVAVATVVSAFVLLRHRRPRSLESSIELFSRELKALEPDANGNRPAPGVGGRAPGAGGLHPSRPTVRSARPVSAASTSPTATASGAVRRLGPAAGLDAGDTDVTGRDGTAAPLPEQEAGPG
jgi:uncharacterized alpha-E superfamily protein